MGGIIMKSEELMVGDWVLINNIPHKIQAIDGIDAEIQADDELYYIGEDRYHSEDKVEGVPLTYEILEKNGWIQCKYETCKSLYEYKGLHLRHTMIKRSNGRWVANVDGIAEKFHDEYAHSFLRINVFYVHTLQHALRLCGLDELADNFEI